jgi:hypothetical protein
MKKLFFVIFYIYIQLPGYAQVWSGTNSTDFTSRNGNVVIGGSSLNGGYGSNERILQLQAEGSWLSMITPSGASFSLGFSASLGTNLYSRASQMAFWTSPTIAGGLAERMRITTDGNVGIGTRLTNNPNNYKLAVNGVIGAKEVQIENTSSTWADYVFEPTYKLMSLQELQLYIASNKHLPEIPSAEEVKNNGHKLGEMDVLLLKKVEELTLYIIELKNENAELMKRLDTLESKR